MRKKSGLILSIIVLFIIFCQVFCEKDIKDILNNVNNITKENPHEGSESNELIEEARVRRKNRHHAFYHYWGWHALAIAYFIKVKLVIVAFFVGTAVTWGLRYFLPHKCGTEVVREGPVAYDHPPTSYSHYDHIPYSFDHSTPYRDHSLEATATFDSISNNEPYSAYADFEPDSVPPVLSKIHRRKRHTLHRHHQRKSMSTEEQIAEFIFRFLGLDSQACRRRFICEMEFRSKLNPLTSMAFRIVGRGFFEKYTNDHNTNGKAASFVQCAAVNDKCTVIDEDLNKEVEEEDIVDEVNANNLDLQNVEISTENSKAETDENLVDDAESIPKRINELNAARPSLHTERPDNALKVKRRRRPRKGTTNNGTVKE